MQDERKLTVELERERGGEEIAPISHQGRQSQDVSGGASAFQIGTNPQ